MHLNDHCDDYAKELEGNWQRFTAFAWHDQPDDAEAWCVVYTHNRDSGCLERSNAECIARELAAFGEDQVRSEHHGHWAVGWVDGYAIRVRDSKGEYTGAFRRWVELALAVAHYPSLDDDRLSELEQEDADLTWRNCYSVSERVAYIRKKRSRFDFRTLADMAGCVRGKYFAGYASELAS